MTESVYCPQWRPVPFVASLQTPDLVCLPPDFNMLACQYFGNSAGYLILSGLLVLEPYRPVDSSFIFPSPDQVIAKNYSANAFGVARDGLIGLWSNGVSGVLLQAYISISINTSTTLRGLCISSNGTLELLTTTGEVLWDQSRKSMFRSVALATGTLPAIYPSPTYTGYNSAESQQNTIIVVAGVVVGLITVIAAFAMRAGTQSSRANVTEATAVEESLPVYEEEISLESIGTAIVLMPPVGANLPYWSLQDVMTWVRVNGGGHIGAETVHAKRIDGAILEVTNVEELMALFELVENRVQLRQALEALKAPPVEVEVPPTEVEAPPNYHENEANV
ncbi:hypothetical protein BC830DRAFT_1172782 [Chytriomyces sp. MP71]|nr:hypothetical protein BC830DRAFT_1172782 [Chytriomyces sp. MP71]